MINNIMPTKQFYVILIMYNLYANHIHINPEGSCQPQLEPQPRFQLKKIHIC